MRVVGPAARRRYRSLVSVAIGIVPHTGWAWVVRVSGSRSAPRIESRSNVVVCDVLDGELYHLAADRPRDRDAFFKGRRAAAVKGARRALDPHLGDVRAALILGKQPRLPPLERIVASHPLIHGAEGELWRAVFAEVCSEGGATVSRAAAAEVRATLEARHGVEAMAAFLARGKRDVGAPWGREPRDAALAAWSVLERAQ